MSGICLVAGLLLAQFGDDITLRWTHSVQKTLWEEDYHREGETLRLVEARVQGSGAGMEAPPTAVLDERGWHYVPTLPSLPRVRLWHSSYVPPYAICAATICQPVTAWLPGLPDETVLELVPCQR